MSRSLDTHPPLPAHVVFSGGGTGGHLFPGLAVAAELRRRHPQLQITFSGNGQEFDRAQVAAAGFAYQGFPSVPATRTLRGLWRFFRHYQEGTRRAGAFLHQQRVQLVVGLGGYASVPVARAALRQRIPLALLEQNVIPGRATRWLARKAELVCLSFDQSRDRLPAGARLFTTGNPLRSSFRQLAQKKVPVEPRRLVVLGGSRGAADLNEHVPRALYKLRAALRGWKIVHVCGRSCEATRLLYEKFNLRAEVSDFVQDMPDLLHGASLAISRAGGTTLAELALLGVPAVLLPYPLATDDHQRANAGVCVQSGGATIVDSRYLTGRLDVQLAATLSPLLQSPQRLRSMGQAMRRLSRPQATAVVADQLEQWVEHPRQAQAA